MQKSLQQLAMRLEELDRSLMDPAVASDGKKLRVVTKERAHLEPIVQLWQQLESSKEELEEAKELAQDIEMAEMAQEEITRLNAEIPDLEQRLKLALIPPDPFEGADIILEVRAGTGGDVHSLPMISFACTLGSVKRTVGKWRFCHRTLSLLGEPGRPRSATRKSSVRSVVVKPIDFCGMSLVCTVCSVSHLLKHRSQYTLLQRPLQLCPFLKKSKWISIPMICASMCSVPVVQVVST